jgi:D-aminopeptidase
MPALGGKALDRAIEALPVPYPRPGGAIAVVKGVEAIIRHGWGYADLETRAPPSVWPRKVAA